jgi:DNA-binding IclR family transcriptional regulator
MRAEALLQMKIQKEPTSAPAERARPQKRGRKRVTSRTSKSTAAAPAELQNSSSGVAAVERALAILDAFGPADQRLTLSDLSKRTTFYKSTILRIAQSLLRHGYLQHLNDGSYQIGPKPLMLGAIYQRSLRIGDILLPLMQELAKQTGESVSFYSRHGDIRVCLHRVDSNHAVRDHVREGDVLLLDRGSGGRVLLAFAGAKGEPYETTRRDHYYISLGERDPETAGISAPVFGSGQLLLGSLTLAGPHSRVDRAFIESTRVPLLRIAARATGALGGDAAPIEVALAAILTGKRRTSRESEATR